MPISRRGFISLFGVSVASLLLSRCKWPQLSRQDPTEIPTAACYAPTQPPELEPTPTKFLSARERLRAGWLSFDRVAQKTVDASAHPGDDNGSAYRVELSTSHRSALDELVAEGTLSKVVADLIQEAYDAAIYHIWRSNVPITCYMTTGLAYTYESASILVRQSEILNQIAVNDKIDPETLVKARAALDHDLAFYSLSEAETQELYKQLSAGGVGYPAFEDVDLAVTPEVKAAGEFIIGLLTQP